MVALLPGCTAATRQVIYSLMTQVFHISTWQGPQLETPLPGSPTTMDGVATGTGLCWHHRIWNYLPWRQNPHSTYMTVSNLCEMLPATRLLEAKVCEQRTLTLHTLYNSISCVHVCAYVNACVHLSVRLSVCPCFIAESLKRHASQSWNELYTTINILQLHLDAVWTDLRGWEMI